MSDTTATQIKREIIDKKEFLRSFEVRPAGAFSIFLGAGASISAGIPATQALIWEFKRKLYCDHFSIKEEKFRDMQLESNRKILQIFFDSQKGNPPLNNAEEYSYYFEKCYPQTVDRKFFIQQKVDKIDPTIGYRCLAELLNAGKIDQIWTTNFDELIERALALQNAKQYKLISPDNSHQVEDIGSTYPKVIKLHGDYRYDRLQNISEETKKLDERLRGYFVESSKTKGLIVVGYNGGDESIVTAIKEALKSDSPFPFGLIWAIRKGSKPNQSVIDIIEEANKKNKLSGFVEIDNFDEFLYELYEKAKINNPAIEHIAETAFEKKKPFSIPQADSSLELIKLNSLIITKYPTTIYAFAVNLKTWKDLRELVKNKNIVASFYKGKVYAFGSLDDIKNVFSSHLASEIQLVDIEKRWLYFEDSFFLGLLYDFLAKSFIDKYKLKQSLTERNRFFSENMKVVSRDIPAHFHVYEAFEIQLFPVDTSLYLLILPTVEAIDTREQSTNNRVEKQELVNKIVSQRYNKPSHDILKTWLELLVNGSSLIEHKLDEFIINISGKYSYGGYKTNSSLDFFQGMTQYPEPKLFYHISDSNYSTTHPLKGLKNFGPYDYSLGGDTSAAVSIGVVSPKGGFSKLLKHLNNLNKPSVAQSDKEYVIEYPGFNKLYKKTLEFPQTASDKLCAIIDEETVKQLTLIEFYELLKKKVDYFDTIRGDFDLLIVYIPKYWSHFRELKNEISYFDLHDSLKIYGAKKNIKIQFIEDKSIDYFDQARISWWLSLAIHTKANGIPWKNQPETENTAYIGIGYAIKNTDANSQVVVGCSQLFDSSGQGLRFLLQPIEKPVFYGKNPYMSKEDARRLILNLRETYFKIDPNAKLDKLVIHKTTHFTKDEIEGIAQASEGIKNVELLQIQQFTSWRALRSYRASSKTLIHFFPVQRGMALQLDDFSFLLWTHGSVTHDEIVLQGRNYYSGGRGIPMPLLIKRFQGTDSIDTVAKSILNLTKMNWNGGQLYKTLPVTLDFSKNLSRVAKQTEALQNYQYDFRFFM